MQIIPKSSSGAMAEVDFTSVLASNPQTRISSALTFTVKIKKAGGTIVTGGGTVTQYDSVNAPGVRTYQGVASDFNTVGPTVLVFTASTMEPREVAVYVSAMDLGNNVTGGLTALPNAVPAASGGLITLGTGAGQINVDGTGSAKAQVTSMVTDAISAAAVSAGAATKLADAVWNYVAENSKTALGTLRVLRAALAGLATGFDTPTRTYKSSDGTKNRIVSTVDNTGRTAVATDES